MQKKRRKKKRNLDTDCGGNGCVLPWLSLHVVSCLWDELIILLYLVEDTLHMATWPFGNAWSLVSSWNFYSFSLHKAASGALLLSSEALEEPALVLILHLKWLYHTVCAPSAPTWSTLSFKAPSQPGRSGITDFFKNFSSWERLPIVTLWGSSLEKFLGTKGGRVCLPCTLSREQGRRSHRGMGAHTVTSSSNMVRGFYGYFFWFNFDLLS